ncbi:MAG: hypothetical protein WCS88_04035 [Patescibacteria group bacterium]|jgi:hypothetical protein
MNMDQVKLEEFEALAKRVLRASYDPQARTSNDERDLAGAVAVLAAELRRMAAGPAPRSTPPEPALPRVPATVEEVLIEATRFAQTTAELLAVAKFRRDLGGGAP